MPRIRVAVLLAASAFLFAVPASSQDVTELSVDEAVRRGIEHNHRVRAARADATAAEASARQVRAAGLPAIRSLATYTRLVGDIPEVEFTVPGLDTTFTLLPIPLNQVHTEVSVEQPLFSGFRLANQTRAARRMARAASLQADQEAADVAFEIRTAYWRLRQATAVRAAVEAALLAVEEHARQVAALVDEGAALRLDLLRAHTRRSEVRLEVVAAENALQVARLELNRLIGMPLDAQIRPTSEAPLALPPELDELIAGAVERRPGLGARQAEVHALEAEVAATRGAWLPRVAAVGRYVLSRPNPIFFLEQDEFRGHLELGFTARWSLFEGGARPAATAQARARLEASRARLADAEEVVAVEAMRRYLEAQRALEAVHVAAEHVAEAEEAFRVVRAQFEEGAALSAEVLDAEQALRAAHAGRARAAADHAIAQAALVNVLGLVR